MLIHLKDLLNRHKLTQAELAARVTRTRKAKCAQPTISRYCASSKGMSQALAWDIAKVVKAEPKFLENGKIMFEVRNPRRSGGSR